MKRFSEFGINVFDDKNYFNVPTISIEEIINNEIEIIDFIPNIKTKHGDNRYIIKIKFENNERKMFTNAKLIKEALNQIQKEDFPFLAIIKQQRFGSGKTFYLS